MASFVACDETLAVVDTARFTAGRGPDNTSSETSRIKATAPSPKPSRITRRRRARSETGILQAVRLLTKQTDRADLDWRYQASYLIYFVEMVHPVIIANDAAEVCAALTDQAVVWPVEELTGGYQRRGTGI